MKIILSSYNYLFGSDLFQKEFLLTLGRKHYCKTNKKDILKYTFLAWIIFFYWQVGFYRGLL